MTSIVSSGNIFEGERSISLEFSNDEALGHLIPNDQSPHHRKGGGSFSATGMTGPLFSTPMSVVVVLNSPAFCPDNR